MEDRSTLARTPVPGGYLRAVRARNRPVFESWIQQPFQIPLARRATVSSKGRKVQPSSRTAFSLL